MFQRFRWTIFVVAAYALFALVAAIVLFSLWLVLKSSIAGEPPPWGAVGSLLGVFFAPAWITGLLAYWHLRRHRRTGHRSAMVETGVSFISALSLFFAILLLFGPL